MIDQTNTRIEEMRDSIQRSNARRYAFYMMLHTTDRVLWRLEEMNRDGMRALTDEARAQIRGQFRELPADVLDVFRDSAHVQVVLDSIFEMQERLFKWRDPSWDVEEEDDLGRLAG